jgi:endonuclease-8
MAEGDTILRAARRIDDAIAGETLHVTANDPRGRAAGVARLNGRRLDRVEARGKHLLLHFDTLVLHSHLGMSGSWRVFQPGERWGKRPSSAWVVLRGSRCEAVQFGGSTLRLLKNAKLRSDPVLSKLGPDVLAADFDITSAIRSLRTAPDLELGEALLDQRLIAGIGNIFKSEACFDAGMNPWSSLSGYSDAELAKVLAAARRLMQESVAKGRPSPAVYRRGGHPCLRCGTPISAHGQGDANRRTYWCGRCQG